MEAAEVAFVDQEIQDTLARTLNRRLSNAVEYGIRLEVVKRLDTKRGVVLLSSS